MFGSKETEAQRREELCPRAHNRRLAPLLPSQWGCLSDLQHTRMPWQHAYTNACTHTHTSHKELISNLLTVTQCILQMVNQRSQPWPCPLPICFLASLPNFNDAKVSLVLLNLTHVGTSKMFIITLNNLVVYRKTNRYYMKAQS